MSENTIEGLLVVFFLFAIPAIIGCCVAAFLKWLDKK